MTAPFEAAIERALEDWHVWTDRPIAAAAWFGAHRASAGNLLGATLLPERSVVPASVVVDDQIAEDRAALLAHAARLRNAPRAAPALLIGRYAAALLAQVARHEELNAVDALCDALGAAMGERLLVHDLMLEGDWSDAPGVAVVTWLSRPWPLGADAAGELP